MTSVPVSPPSRDELRRAQLRGLAALCEREVVRVLRLWTQTVAPQVISAVLFIVVFGMALGGRIRTIHGIPYTEFIVPGLVLMGVATAAFANNASSLYQARSEGFIEDPVSSPMSATQLALGYTAGGVVRGILIAVGTLIAARFFVPVNIAHPALLVAALVAAACAFAALGTVIGLYSKGWELQSFTGTLVLQPLVFLGGVFYSVSDLAEPWHGLTRADPILYMVEAVRYAMHGTSPLAPWLSIGVTVGVAVATLAWSWLLFVRGVGLRT